MKVSKRWSQDFSGLNGTRWTELYRWRWQAEMDRFIMSGNPFAPGIRPIGEPYLTKERITHD